jgi:signal transduction histidine kinase
MLKPKLRTQFLVATLLVIATLTGGSLLIIRYTVRSEIDTQVHRGVLASVRAFEGVQQQRELQLSRTAAILAEQPILKALMTTEHAPTIQDASIALWRLTGSDLLVLTSPDGRILANHVSSMSGTSSEVADFAARSIREGQENSWWFNKGGLYWTFLRPVTAGTGASNRLLGYLILGYQINSNIAAELARVSGSEIFLATEHEIIASTFPKSTDAELSEIVAEKREQLSLGTRDISVAGQAYAGGSVRLQESPTAPIYCYVLMPLSQAETFLRRLNITIFVLGIAAVFAAAVIITWISRAITSPLDNLVAGVRALSAGDYSYRISPTGSAEVAELGTAFAGMRIRLQESQRLRLEAEQHAVVSRTASAISHDLRHYLAAVLANAEFLYDARASDSERREIYDEIRTASDQMVDLIDSLRELANEQAAMTVRPATIDETVDRAITAVKARPEFKNCGITVHKSGDMNGSFDERKMERVFFNLVLNACESGVLPGGDVEITIDSLESGFEIEVTDHGTGIPASIRDRVFDPFISVGKPNGSGLGLAIVQKIVRDHRGSVSVVASSQQGTTIKVSLPREMSLEAVPQPVSR